MSTIGSIQPAGIRVASLPDVQHAANCAREIAASIGFPTNDCEQIALAVTELASNLIKHAGGGTLTLASRAEASRIGIRIESDDSGPGITNVDKALTDGYSTAGSLGVGLGAVNRLMDDLELSSLPSAGTHIVCHRWLRPGSDTERVRWLDFGAATRSFRYQKENGDAFIVRQWSGNALAGVIDGLGHGQFAQRAAQTARRYIEEHFDQSLDDLFRGTGRTCHATRGVVMALARFDYGRQTCSIASVGNIEVHVINNPSPNKVIVRRGIVGFNAPKPITTEVPWTRQTIAIMHSDGLKTHWSWKDFPELAHESASVIARRLLSVLGKEDDDATVLVVRHAPP